MSGKTAEVVLYETMKQAKQQEKTLTSCSTNDYLGEERRSAEVTRVGYPTSVKEEKGLCILDAYRWKGGLVFACFSE